MRFIILILCVFVVSFPSTSFAALDYGKQSLLGADFSGSDLKGATFYLTDFLVKNFERLIIDGLGISENPSLKKVYFRNYKNIVYLAQKPDNDLQTKAKECADYLNLEFSMQFTGLDNFENQLNKALI